MKVYDKKIKVLVNDKKDRSKRVVVNADFLEDSPSTVLVRLPDGKIVTRKKSRDLSKEK